MYPLSIQPVSKVFTLQNRSLLILLTISKRSMHMNESNRWWINIIVPLHSSSYNKYVQSISIPSLSYSFRAHWVINLPSIMPRWFFVPWCLYFKGKLTLTVPTWYSRFAMLHQDSAHHQPGFHCNANWEHIVSLTNFIEEYPEKHNNDERQCIAGM